MFPQRFLNFFLIFVVIAFLIVAISPSVFAVDSIKKQFENSLQKTGGLDGAGYPQVSPALAQNFLMVKIGTYIQVALSFLGVIFLVLMIYGGYVWMKARGNETDVTRAKDIITNAGIGLVIVISAYAISYFVIFYLQSPALIAPAAPTPAG